MRYAEMLLSFLITKTNFFLKPARTAGQEPKPEEHDNEQRNNKNYIIQIFTFKQADMKTPLHKNGPVSGHLMHHLIKRIAFVLPLLALAMGSAQNTATASGAWSSCTTWGNPPAIYRNTSDTKTVSSGVTVTADASWSTGALVLNGSGAVNYNSGIITDFVNDQGADVTCDAVYAALQSSGCASCNAYNSQSAGKYIRITEAEYNAVRSQLSNITIAGANDSQMNSNVTTTTGDGTYSTAASYAKAPPYSYVVAFFFRTIGVSTVDGNGIFKLKYNTTGNPNSGYADYAQGGNYGVFTYNSLGLQNIYFVIKHPTQTTFNGGNSYLGYYVTGGIPVAQNPDTMWIGPGADTSSPTTVVNYGCAFQAVTTTVKQWN